MQTLPRITQLHGTVLKKSGTDFWVVERPFIWWVYFHRQENWDPKIIVPTGFKTNFGSIPRIFWPLLNPTAWNAYVLHDYLYSQQMFQDRIECDYILYEALVAEGCSKVEACIVYFGLYLFGKKAWTGYNKG